MQNRLEQLEEIARAAFDAVISVDEWLGSAGTREAATDALRRLEIKLRAAGFEAPIGKNLDFRGAILDDLERMGLRYDCRDDSLHFLCLGRRAAMPAAQGWLTSLQLFGTACKRMLASNCPKSQVKRWGRERGGKP